MDYEMASRMQPAFPLWTVRPIRCFKYLNDNFSAVTFLHAEDNFFQERETAYANAA